MLSNILRSTTRQRARVVVQRLGSQAPKPGMSPVAMPRSCQTLAIPRPRPILCWRRSIFGASLLIASCGMLAQAPTALSLGRDAKAAKCEESPAPIPEKVQKETEPKPSPLGTILK
ncbi:unnamed protein product, partial [Symbiodinium natans]